MQNNRYIRPVLTVNELVIEAYSVRRQTWAIMSILFYGTGNGNTR
jgi:hypothetical protein